MPDDDAARIKSLQEQLDRHIAQSKNLENGSKSVTINGASVALKGSYLGKSTGNEAGTVGGGVVSAQREATNRRRCDTKTLPVPGVTDPGWRRAPVARSLARVPHRQAASVLHRPELELLDAPTPPDRKRLSCGKDGCDPEEEGSLPGFGAPRQRSPDEP